MDLAKILNGIENSEELIKKIQAEIGADYVPRSEFNAKNEKLKEAETQITGLTTTNTALEGKKTEWEKQLAELNDKIKGYETSALKAKIARETGIPYEFAARLAGEDEKSIKADAESLSDFFKNKMSKEPLKSTEPNLGNDKDAKYREFLKELEKGD